MSAAERPAAPFLAGEIQFWRMDPSEWRPAILSAKTAGLGIVSTYLSWRRHEPEPGEFDFGEGDPRLDVCAFLRLCAEEGMRVHLKPGPWICAEEKGGGYPDWLLARSEMLAVDDRGFAVLGYNPPFQHFVPSYSSPEYRATAERWLRAVWRAVGGFLAPIGPVALVQLDNEPSLCFQDSTFGGDYHPSAIARFREWLVERYGSVRAVAEAWGLPVSDAALLDPPRRPSLGEPLVIDRRLDDWILFHGVSIAEHLAFLRQVHVDAGAEHVAFTINLVTHPVHDVPVSHALLRKTVGALIGEDHYYIPHPALADIHRLARSAATARAAGEPLPWIPELQAGIWRSPGEQVDYPDPTPAEQSAWWGAAIAVGFGGVNFYMLADRENWQNAPFTRDGSPSAFMESLKRLLTIARDHPTALTGATVPDVVVAWHRPDARRAYAVTGTSRVPEVSWADADASAAYWSWDDALTRLTAAGVSYDLWPTDTPLPDSDVPLLVPPGSGVEAGLLASACAAGRTVLRPRNEAELDEVLTDGVLVPAVAVLEVDGTPADEVVVAIRRDADDYVHIASFRDAPLDAVLRFRDGCSGEIVPSVGDDAIACAAGTARLVIEPGHTVLRRRRA